MFGKQIQNTSIGATKARLKNNLETLVPVVFVDRYEPTTKTCSFCGHIQEVKLSERTFKCKNYGREIDRDVKFVPRRSRKPSVLTEGGSHKKKNKNITTEKISEDSTNTFQKFTIQFYDKKARMLSFSKERF